MRRVTKVICRFIATEYDEAGHVLSELPVAAGKETFTATIYYPFDLTAYIDRMNEDLNAKEGTEELQGGVQGLPREAGADQAAVDEEPGA